MTLEEIIASFHAERNPENIAGMARFGIRVEKAFGISAPALRALAKRIGKDHDLAQQLWASEYHEARVLAAFIDDPMSVTKPQMERWAHAFDSWDICDGCCIHLFRKTPFAFQKIEEWTPSSEEFVKRAGFALIATLAVHAKQADDSVFLHFLEFISAASADERNFVKKAVNWALRQIGKRNRALHEAALKCATELCERDSKSARWIGRDAVRELTDDKIIQRIKV